MRHKKYTRYRIRTMALLLALSVLSPSMLHVQAQEEIGEIEEVVIEETEPLGVEELTDDDVLFDEPVGDKGDLTVSFIEEDDVVLDEIIIPEKPVDIVSEETIILEETVISEDAETPKAEDIPEEEKTLDFTLIDMANEDAMEWEEGKQSVKNTEDEYLYEESLYAYSTGYPCTWNNTGNSAVDLVNVALTQVGYAETSSNHTKYNAWYYEYDNPAAWCAIFISWCANTAGIPSSVIPRTASPRTLANAMTYITDFSVTPQSGDLVFFGSKDHVAIVVDYNASTRTITFVGGNQSDKVTKSTVKWASGGKWGSQSVTAIGRPWHTNTNLPARTNAPAVFTSIGSNKVTVTWNDVEYEDSYYVCLVQAPWRWEDIKYTKTVSANVTSCIFDGVAVGEYCAFVISRPNADGVQSPWSSFTIEAEKGKSTFTFRFDSNGGDGYIAPFTETHNIVGTDQMWAIMRNFGDRTLRAYQRDGYTFEGFHLKHDDLNVWKVENGWASESQILNSTGLSKTIYKSDFQYNNGWGNEVRTYNYTFYAVWKPIPVTGVSVDRMSATIVAGDALQLYASVFPSNALNEGMTWTSSAENVATVNSDGLVITKNAGTAVITVTHAASGLSVNCTITVKEPVIDVTGIDMNHSAISVEIGKNLQLAAVVFPTNATTKTVNWKSSNTSVATVSSSGLVTAKSEGVVVITATTNGVDENGNALTTTCEVTVTAPSGGAGGNTGGSTDGGSTSGGGGTGGGTGGGGTGGGGTTKPKTPDELTKDFITRAYREILSRTPDTSGMNYWFGELKAKRLGGGMMVAQFLNSREFINKKYDSGKTMDIMYRVYMDRTPEESGKKFWTDYLDNGLSVIYVAKGFTASAEFKNICKSYGIDPGTVALTQNRDQNEKVTRFVARCYQESLGRNGEESGLNYWTGELLAKRITPAKVAEQFVFSKEMNSKGYDNSRFIQMLYRLCMGRTYDQGGLNYWLGEMNKGMTRQQVFTHFVNSREFQNIVKSYGL